jgi:hypothetical protein
MITKFNGVFSGDQLSHYGMNLHRFRSLSLYHQGMMVTVSETSVISYWSPNKTSRQDLLRFNKYATQRSRDSSVGIATGYRLNGRDSIPGKDKRFVFRKAMGLTQPPIQSISRVHSAGVNGRSVKLTTHLHLVPRLKNAGAIPPLPYTSSWRIA